MGTHALSTIGTSGQCSTLLAEAAAGQHLLALCHYEQDGGYARDYVETIAKADADGFVLSGRKAFTLHAHAADSLLVSARIGSNTGPTALFIVPRDSAGVSLVVAPALAMRKGAAVTLNDVHLGLEALLGDAQTDVTSVLEQLLDCGVCGSSQSDGGSY